MQKENQKTMPAKQQGEPLKAIKVEQQRFEYCFEKSFPRNLLFLSVHSNEGKRAEVFEAHKDPRGVPEVQKDVTPP